MVMASNKYTELLTVATTAAQAGAQVVQSNVDQPRRIEFKGVADLVTNTDKASEAAILEVLQRECPDHGFLGEEGTTNFASSYPSFAVSVAAVVEFSGGLGSWMQRLYTASEGGGATCNDCALNVTQTSNLGQSLLVTGFGYDHGAPWQTNMELFKELTDASRGVRRLGAAAVDLCHVAAGMSDAYWEFLLKPWDCAAGVLLVREAGGRVTTMDGQPYTVFDRSMLASGPHLHDPLLEKMAPHMTQLRQSEDFSNWFVPNGYEKFVMQARSA
eukprot:jgi/Astpho2/537/Aster-03566